MKLSLACNRVTELVSLSQDRRLSIRERFALRLHIRACETCGLFQKQIRMLSETIRRRQVREPEKYYPQPPGLSPEALDRIKLKLKHRRDPEQ